MKKSFKENVLVVAAHPDDELLGLGGALCIHRDKGDEISILLLANGEDSRGATMSNPSKRLEQAKKVATRLKATLYLADFPDNSFDSVSLLEIAKKVESVVEISNPDIIYTHHPDDVNVDHVLTSMAVTIAARPIDDKKRITKILAFETLSSTEWQMNKDKMFAPNYYVDISKYIEEKKKLLMIYKYELRIYPHSRSLKGVEILAQYRGLETGMAMAEAFRVLRIIT